MKAKNQPKAKEIMMELLKYGSTVTWDKYSSRQKIISAGIDNDYQYVVKAEYSSANHYFSAIVKDDQMLINFLIKLARHNYKYRISKIRKRARKINPATIS